MHLTSGPFLAYFLIVTLIAQCAIALTFFLFWLPTRRVLKREPLTDTKNLIV